MRPCSPHDLSLTLHLNLFYPRSYRANPDNLIWGVGYTGVTQSQSAVPWCVPDFLCRMPPSRPERCCVAGTFQNTRTPHLLWRCWRVVLRARLPALHMCLRVWTPAAPLMMRISAAILTGRGRSSFLPMATTRTETTTTSASTSAFAFSTSAFAFSASVQLNEIKSPAWLLSRAPG